MSTLLSTLLIVSVILCYSFILVTVCVLIIRVMLCVLYLTITGRRLDTDLNLLFQYIKAKYNV